MLQRVPATSTHQASLHNPLFLARCTSCHCSCNTLNAMQYTTHTPLLLLQADDIGPCSPSLRRNSAARMNTAYCCCCCCYCFELQPAGMQTPHGYCQCCCLQHCCCCGSCSAAEQHLGWACGVAADAAGGMQLCGRGVCGHCNQAWSVKRPQWMSWPTPANPVQQSCIRACRLDKQNMTLSTC